MGKGDRDHREIGDPESHLLTADLALRSFAVRRKAIVPEARGARVMFAPGLEVVHLKAVKLQVGNRHADMIEFAAGKDVAADRGGGGAVAPAAAPEALVGVGSERDRVMK